MPLISTIAGGSARGFGGLKTFGVPYAGPFGAYDALATITVPSGGVASVTFAGIPTGYKHLQVRAMHLYTPNADNIVGTYNGGTAGTISHFIYGDGTTTALAGNDNASGGILSLQSGSTSTAFICSIWDYLDYASTSKNKVVRGLTGQDRNGAGHIALISNLVQTTSPITSIKYAYYNGNSMVSGTHFALYGVK